MAGQLNFVKWAGYYQQRNLLEDARRFPNLTNEQVFALAQEQNAETIFISEPIDSPANFFALNTDKWLVNDSQTLEAAWNELCAVPSYVEGIRLGTRDFGNVE